MRTQAHRILKRDDVIVVVETIIKETVLQADTAKVARGVIKHHARFVWIASRT